MNAPARVPHTVLPGCVVLDSRNIDQGYVTLGFGDHVTASEFLTLFNILSSRSLNQRDWTKLVNALPGTVIEQCFVQAIRNPCNDR